MNNLKDYLPINMEIMEAVRSSQFGRAIDIMRSYFRKHNVLVYKNIYQNVTVAGKKYRCIFVRCSKNKNGAIMLFDVNGDSTGFSGISFTTDAARFLNAIFFGGSMKFDVQINTEGAGVTISAVLPYVADVLNGDQPMDGKSILKFLDAHSLNGVHEGLFEDKELDDLVDRHDKLVHKKSYNKRAGKPIDDIEREIADIKQKIQIKRSVAVTVPKSTDKTLETAETALIERATPQQRFKDVEHYINMILKGLKPLLVLCGAPGVGKTFRVMRKIKAAGRNCKLIKGKETPAQFFCDLFLYRHKGDIIVCDDADDVLTDEVITNLIKAATDSSDERIVTYGTTRPPVMSEEMFMCLPPEDQEMCSVDRNLYFYPREFETKGSMIIITNYPAGKVDTAVRNRGLLCDLQFTTEEILSLVAELAPAIMPGELSDQSKGKALDYLNELAKSGAAMEVSIRSFCTVAIVYEGIDGEDDVTESDIERMIREQMDLASRRGGKKY